MIFVDTSGLLAFLDRSALRHADVLEVSAEILAGRQALTHNYVLLETEALARRRLGGAAARRLLEDVVPVIEVVWVDGELHRSAVDRLLRTPRRRSSLVDHVSFEVMRRLEIRSALGLDRDFAREGFELLP